MEPVNQQIKTATINAKPVAASASDDNEEVEILYNYYYEMILHDGTKYDSPLYETIELAHQALNKAMGYKVEFLHHE